MAGRPSARDAIRFCFLSLRVSVSLSPRSVYFLSFFLILPFPLEAFILCLKNTRGEKCKACLAKDLSCPEIKLDCLFVSFSFVSVSFSRFPFSLVSSPALSVSPFPRFFHSLRSLLSFIPYLRSINKVWGAMQCDIQKWWITKRIYNVCLSNR